MRIYLTTAWILFLASLSVNTPVHAETRKINLEEYQELMKGITGEANYTDKIVDPNLTRLVLSKGVVLSEYQTFSGFDQQVFIYTRLVSYKTDYFQCTFWSKSTESSMWCAKYSFRR